MGWRSDAAPTGSVAGVSLEIGGERIASGVPIHAAIIGFLGYNPLPEATTWGERLIRHRA
jgi:hypothetical protein